MKFLFFLLFMSVGLQGFSQQTASGLLKEGVELYEQGLYKESIEKYDAAIALDKNHYMAYANKSLALFKLKQYEASISVSKFMLEHFRNDSDIASVYVSYGTCLDLLGKPEEALKIYNEGIKAYPDEALLYFNKAITLFNSQRTDEAIEAVKLSIIHNPYHASSHNVLTLGAADNKIYSLMASLVFLAIEPNSKRSVVQLKNVETILNANVKKTGDNSISISLDNSILDNKKSDKEDNFGSVELMMSMGSALNHDDKYKNETPPQRLQRIIGLVINTLSLHQKDGKGFGWKYYAPFIIDLEKQKHLETYCHIIYSNSGDASVSAWLTENKARVDEFNTWFRSYTWNRNF